MSIPTEPNPVYIQRLQSRQACVERVAWQAALGQIGYVSPATTTQQARDLFNRAREVYWTVRVRLAVPGEFNSYNQARMAAGKAPIGPDGFPIELDHREELNANPARALDPANVWELFRRQHDFQHGNYAFRWHPGSLPESPQSAGLSREFGNPLEHRYWP